MHFSAKRPGLTILELAISTAIIAILTAATFLSLNRERTKSSVRRAAEQMQVDIQGVQIRAQSGLVLPPPTLLCNKILVNGDPDPNVGKPCSNPANPTVDCSNPNSTCTAQPPISYGIRFITGHNAYRQFADIDSDGSAGIHPNRIYDGGVEDGIQTVLPNLQIGTIRDGAGASHNRLDLTFDVPTGKVYLTFQNPSPDCVATPSACLAASITILNPTPNLCYSVTIDAAALGTVNRRAIATCP